MPNKVSDLAKTIISEYYDSLGSIAAHEAMTVRFTAQLNYEDLALIDAVASRFSDTRANLVGEILSNMAMELFLAIPKDERKSIAEVAATNCKTHEEKNNFSSSGQSKWAYLASSDQSEDYTNA